MNKAFKTGSPPAQSAQCTMYSAPCDAPMGTVGGIPTKSSPPVNTAMNGDLNTHSKSPGEINRRTGEV